MAKKIPMRNCIVTQEHFPKQELLRIVRTPEGNIEIDPTGKMNGHGAYLKKDASIIPLAKKKNSLGIALKTTIPDEFWDRLHEYMK